MGFDGQKNEQIIYVIMNLDGFVSLYYILKNSNLQNFVSGLHIILVLGISTRLREPLRGLVNQYEAKLASVRYWDSLRGCSNLCSEKLWIQLRLSTLQGSVSNCVRISVIRMLEFWISILTLNLQTFQNGLRCHTSNFEKPL